MVRVESQLAFSCLVHGPWWKVYLCESYLAATSDQAMASFLWQRKAGAELEKVKALFVFQFLFLVCFPSVIYFRGCRPRFISSQQTGLLQLRAEDASGVGGHGGHSHSHAHGGG